MKITLQDGDFKVEMESDQSRCPHDADELLARAIDTMHELRSRGAKKGAGFSSPPEPPAPETP